MLERLSSVSIEICEFYMHLKGPEGYVLKPLRSRGYHWLHGVSKQTTPSLLLPASRTPNGRLRSDRTPLSWGRCRPPFAAPGNLSWGTSQDSSGARLTCFRQKQRASFRDAETTKPINIKNFGGTPPGLWGGICPVDMSHLSQSSVPSVPRTFHAPMNVEILPH